MARAGAPIHACRDRCGPAAPEQGNYGDALPAMTPGSGAWPRHGWLRRQRRPSLTRLLLCAALALLISTLVVLTVSSRQLLLVTGAALLGGERQTEHVLLLAAVGFVLASVTAVLVQTVRIGNRVAGPEYRLIQVLRRIRQGDLTVRAHLRAGDLLRPLASECNDLLEWLNENPPRGSVTGSDLVEIEQLATMPAESERLEVVQR